MSYYFEIGDLVQVKSDLKRGKVVSFKRMVHKDRAEVEDAYMVRHRNSIGIYFIDEIEGVIIG